MLISSLVTFALSINAVSAVAFPETGATPKPPSSCGTYCLFPSSIDCPVNGGVHIMQDALEQAVANADRSGQPVDTSAANESSGHCATPKFHDIPYWTVRFLWALHLFCRSLDANF